MTALAPYLIIGQVLKPQGVRGEVKVKPITGDPERFADLLRVFLLHDGQYEPRAVRVSRVHDGFVYMRFDGIDDREDAEALRGELLHIDRANAVALPDDTVFVCDLIGCEVFDTDGQSVGTLTDVLQPGANDVYVVATPKGELLIPALKRAVPVVDVSARRVIVDAQVLAEVAVYPE